MRSSRRRRIEDEDEVRRAVRTEGAQLAGLRTARFGGRIGTLQRRSVRVPRDRDASFEPQLVPKHQRRLVGFDEKVIALYARGMTTRQIQGHLEELYHTSVSPDLISTVTDAVIEDARAWQSRPLEALYPIVFLDALFVKMRRPEGIRRCAVYVALGINLEGKRSVLGLWMAETEKASFWLSVLTELKGRGVEDVFYCCVDGLKGFEGAIEAVFPRAIVQQCIVHLVRASLRYVAQKDRKAVAASLRAIYQAPTAEAAEATLEALNAEMAAEAPAGEAPLVLRAGIGLNSGPCLAGNLGTLKRFNYSVLGDPVNVAARLEALTRTYDVDVILGEATVSALDGRYALLELDLLQVKGRQRSARIFALLGAAELADDPAFAAFAAAHDSMIAAAHGGDPATARRLLADNRAAAERFGVGCVYDLYAERMGAAEPARQRA